MKYLLAALVTVAAFSGATGVASDVFSEGEKLLAGKKKPVVIRVNPATDEAVLFKADTLDRATLQRLSGATKSEQEAATSEALASVEKRENELPLFAGKKGKDESTAACYGYYYGYYPWIYYRPIYITYTVTVTYYYSWHTYHHGYVYYWYL